MKLSMVIVSAFLVGVVSYLGPEAGKLHHRDRVFRKGGDSREFTHFPHHGEDRTLGELRSLESAVQKRIRDVESALRKIASSEGYIARRLEELRRDRRKHSHSLFHGEKDALSSGEDALLMQVKALEEERLAFTGLLERLKSEQASLKVKIDLWGVRTKRAMVEEFLGGGEARGPLDELQDDIHLRTTRKNGHQGIVY